MGFEKLSELTTEQKKMILSNLIENDVSYWKKLLILMSMVDENEGTELIDLIIEHKIEEIDLANKKYNLFLKYNELDNEKENYISVMEKIINGCNNEKYGKACKEVLEILKYIPSNYYFRISKKFIQRLETNADSTHQFLITDNMQFDDLEILDETQKILLLISNKFWNINGRKINISEIFNKKEK